MRSFQVVANQTGFPSQFTNLRHDARGASFLLPHQQLGTIAIPDAPTNGQTITLSISGNSIVLTAVGTIGSAAGNILNPGTAAGYAANILAILNQPQTTTANGVALSEADWQFLSYLSFSLVGTTITVSSNNTSLYPPLTSFSVSTNVTGASWSAQTMQLYVEPGVVYVGGTRVIFSGGCTPTVTAPTSHPRIDVLAIDNTGTLSWTTGTESASPTAPAYPLNKVALCELYNVVGETALEDNENQTSGQGYIYHDVRPTIGTAVNLGAVAQDILPDADGTRSLGSLSFEFENLYVKSGIFLNGAAVTQSTTYAGTAGEAISAGAAVAIANLPSDGGPKLDTGSSGTFTGTGATVPFTVGSNSNRLMVVCLFNASATSTPSGSNAAFNGSSLTTIQAVSSTNSGTTLMAHLIAPSTGAHNLVFSGLTSGTYSYTIHSYYNAAQSSPIDTSNQTTSGSFTTISLSISPTNSACLLFALVARPSPAGSFVSSTFPNNTETNGNLLTGDNGLYLPPGSWSASATFSTGGSNGVIMAAAIKPSGTPTPSVYNASSSTNTQGNGRYVGYIGIAVGSASAGNPITVYIGGIASGLSSLSIGQQYYLNDTNGTIGTSAGTNSRKAGLAISTTQLLVTNIW